MIVKLKYVLHVLQVLNAANLPGCSLNPSECVARANRDRLSATPRRPPASSWSLFSNAASTVATSEAMLPQGFRWGMRSRKAVFSRVFWMVATGGLNAGMDLQAGKGSVKHAVLTCVLRLLRIGSVFHLLSAASAVRGIRALGEFSTAQAGSVADSCTAASTAAKLPAVTCCSQLLLLLLLPGCLVAEAVLGVLLLRGCRILLRTWVACGGVL